MASPPALRAVDKDGFPRRSGKGKSGVNQKSRPCGTPFLLIPILTLRLGTAIFLSLLLHLGVFARMVRAEDHGHDAVSAVEECCRHGHASPACGEDHSHGCPEDTDCPVDGDHCHHHGACAVHGIFLLSPSEKSITLLSPEGRDLAFEILDDRPEDGPVMKLDKPPLI
jgi:hypothetical protein